MRPPENDAARVPETQAGANDRSTTPNSTPEAQVRQFLRVLVAEGAVFEIRVLNCTDRAGSNYPYTVSGYYQHGQIESAVTDIVALDVTGRAPTIYITLNPVNPDLLARSANRLRYRARETTKDAEVVGRHWMLIDCDPVRPAGISSTDRELALSLAKAEQVRAALSALGWPEPVVLMSGNGYHLLCRIDLSAEDGGLVQRVLGGLADRFDDAAVKIDRSVHNPARITKVAGTVAAGKGDDLVGVEGVEDRPHRRARLVSVPEMVGVVSRQLLEELAPKPEPTSSPSPQTTSKPRSNDSTVFERFDHDAAGVRGYLERHGLTVKGEKRDGSATLLFLDRCPVNPDCQSVNDSDIAVIVADDGTIAYKNWHNRGEGLRWLDVREALEPGYKAWVQAGGGAVVVPRPAAPPRAIESYRPFPADAVPAPVRGYITATARALNCDGGFVALPVVAALASCVGTTRRIHIKKSWKEPCIVWSVIVAPSGTLKSPAFDAAVEPLRVRQGKDIRFYQEQMEEYEKAQLTYERDRDLFRKGKLDGPCPEKPKAPVCTRRAVSDITIEALAPVLLENPRGTLLARDELAGWVNAFDAYRQGRGGDVSKWLETHRGGEILVDRKTGPDRLIRVPRAAVSVTGCTQPRVLTRVWDTQNLANGFAARLLTCAPPKQVKVWTEADVEPAVAERYDGVVGGLLNLKHAPVADEPWTPIDLEFNQDARSRWVRFYNDFGVEQANIGDEDIAAAFSKLEGYCARFASCSTSSEWSAATAR
jgi:hypothetical protein